jgi:hypothetical protein
MIRGGGLRELLHQWGLCDTGQATDLPLTLVDLLTRILVVDDPTQRLSLQQIGQHAWLA